MPRQYAAFLSYSRTVASWVETLRLNLEKTLAHNGHAGRAGSDPRVFKDDVDLAAGVFWGGRLEHALKDSDAFVLVITPEAMVSSWVGQETEAIKAMGRLPSVVPVMLVESPTSPFVGSLQHVDLTDHDEVKYRDGLACLAARVMGRTNPRSRADLPPDLDIPDPPERGLEPKLRSRLVTAMAPLFGDERDCSFAEQALSLPESVSLDGFAPGEAAASAALVLATGDDDPRQAAVRVVGQLTDAFGRFYPKPVEELESLKEPLRTAGAHAPESGLLARYLRWIDDEHSKLVDYFQQDQELESLDRIYVELEARFEERAGLRGHERVAKADPSQDLTPEPERRMSIRELLGMDPEQHSAHDITGRWVVLGDPGGGKSTLVRHLASSLAREQTPRWIPVFVSLPRAMREGASTLFERLERRLARANIPSNGLRSVLESEGRAGRLLLLLDGLDEVPRDDRQDAEALLRTLSERWPQTPIIVTSRPIGYRRPSNEYREIRLLPFDRDRRVEFLANWFGRRAAEPDRHRAESCVARLESDHGLWELSGNPLYLTLMALILEQDNEPARNRSRLYDQVFDLLLEGGHRPEPKAIDNKGAVRDTLRFLGYGMTQTNRDAAPLEDLERALYSKPADSLREELDRVPEWRRSMRAFLDDLAERTGILGPHDGRDADWRFWHRTLREALASEQLEQRFERDGAQVVLDQARAIEGNESAWAEPFALLTARVPDPDELVRSLMEANETLGLRALATAERLSDDTIPQLLQLSGDIDDRATVYLRLPEVIDDGERVLLLLDRLRIDQLPVEDLYFLDLVAGQVAETWEDLADRSAALRSRLYDHLPEVPTELFGTVVTRDGEVPLWCEIPPGELHLEDGDSVPIEAFRMAAVPVTNAMYQAFDRRHEAQGWEGVSDDELLLHPAVNVSWYQATVFCRWLSARSHHMADARLPTEWEWEHACRAGSDTTYWSGDSEADLDRVGWYVENSSSRTHRVGRKDASPWGLLDVHGNVYEWNDSLWNPEDEGETSGDRGLRGGSWGIPAVWARSADRNGFRPGDRDLNIGFRVALPASR